MLPLAGRGYDKQGGYIKPHKDGTNARTVLGSGYAVGASARSPFPAIPAQGVRWPGSEVTATGMSMWFL